MARFRRDCVTGHWHLPDGRVVSHAEFMADNHAFSFPVALPNPASSSSGRGAEGGEKPGARASMDKLVEHLVKHGASSSFASEKARNAARDWDRRVDSGAIKPR